MGALPGKLLQGLWTADAPSQNWPAFAVLLGMLGVATAVAVRFFRWE